MLLQPNTTFDNHYTLIRQLGRGGFSEVWLAHDSYMDIDIAIKIYAPGQGMDSNSINEFRREITGVFQLNHPNLLCPKHLGIWENMPYLIMAYCPAGSCLKFVGNISESEIWHLIHDVAAGLAYLHEKDIVHQDIKPDNILIDTEGNYLITDFGISTRARSTLRKSVMSTTYSAGTLAYMGPERFSTQPAPTKASDIWSLGAMLYELLEGVTPFPPDFGGSMLNAGAAIPTINAPVSENLKQTIYKMLSKETWDRPTAEQLMKSIKINNHSSKTKLQIAKNENAPTSITPKIIVISAILLFVLFAIGISCYFTSSKYKIKDFEQRLSNGSIYARIEHKTKDYSDWALNKYVISDVLEEFTIDYYTYNAKVDFDIQGANIVKREVGVFSNAEDITLQIQPSSDSLHIIVYAIVEGKRYDIDSFVYSIQNVDVPTMKIDHLVPAWQDSSVMYIGRKERVKVAQPSRVEIIGGADITSGYDTWTIIPHDTSKFITVSSYYYSYKQYRLANTKTYKVLVEKTNAPQGAFSVGHKKYVYFASGNLQYNPTYKQWRFAPKEWERIGHNNTNSHYSYGLGYSQDNWYDLFKYGASGYQNTDPMYYSCSGFDIANTYYDWGKYINIINSNYSTWRTPTYEECCFLFKDRPHADKLYSIGTVNGIHGLIILPDNWICPSGLTFEPLAKSPAINSYFDDDWNVMKNNGAVFLPAAGRMVSSSVVGASPNGDWEGGDYWTSTCWKSNTKNAYIISFSMGHNNEKMMDGGLDVSTRLSVRLVRNVK